MVVADDDSGLIFVLVSVLTGDKVNAGTSNGGAPVSSLRKLLVRFKLLGWEKEDSRSDMRGCVLGLIAVGVGLTDTGGSGRGQEGGGEIGGDDFLDKIRGGGGYIIKKISCILLLKQKSLP
jgi:hypothetical protein